jgi:regulator of sigma E protease
MIAFLVTLLVFLLILSVLVLIHEAGHYFVAKKLGIKVEEFGFGFPVTPALFSHKHGETIYSFYPVLIGGFVKLYGEDEAGGGKISPKVSGHSKDLHRAFFSRPLWQRTAVIVAGVLMNVLLAAVIYYVYLGMSGFRTELPLYGDHTFFLVNQQIKSDIIINEISKNSPAAQAGIVPFSKVISVNGQPMISAEMFASAIKENIGRQIVVEWVDLKTSKRSHATMTPRVNPPPKEGSLGVGFFPSKTIVLSYDTIEQKILSGFTYPANAMSYQFDILGKLIGISIKEKSTKPVGQAMSGPVGIGFYVGAVVGQVDAQKRIMDLLNLAGLLSMSLAVFNILPIPGLDGGRFFFILLEVITGKKVDPKIEGYIHSVGMSLLLLLMVVITWNDISLHKDEIFNFFKNIFSR